MAATGGTDGSDITDGSKDGNDVTDGGTDDTGGADGGKDGHDVRDGRLSDKRPCTRSRVVRQGMSGAVVTENLGKYKDITRTSVDALVPYWGQIKTHNVSILCNSFRPSSV